MFQSRSRQTVFKNLIGSIIIGSEIFQTWSDRRFENPDLIELDRIVDFKSIRSSSADPCFKLSFMPILFTCISVPPEFQVGLESRPKLIPCTLRYSHFQSPIRQFVVKFSHMCSETQTHAFGFWVKNQIKVFVIKWFLKF